MYLHVKFKPPSIAFCNRRRLIGYRRKTTDYFHTPFYAFLFSVGIAFDDNVSAANFGIRKARFPVKFAVRRHREKRGINVRDFSLVTHEFIPAEVHPHVHVLVKTFFYGLFYRSDTRTRFNHKRIIAEKRIF